ncbi:MAG: SCO family protein [Proteobacteria bacterium]|nr:SCO family protein [Pseudomonadota bacterium]
MRRAHVRGTTLQSTLLILVAALAAGLGLWAADRWFTPAAPIPPPPLKVVDLFPITRAISPFALDKGDGSKLTPAALKGHWSLVYIGYTHCPDVCPTTLQMLGVAEKSWADLPAGKRPRIVFVSVDPGRDTPAHTAQYAHYFGKDIDGVTGDAATLERFVHDLGLVYFVDAGKGGNYAVDHSAAVAVLDPDGNEAGLIRPAPPPAQPFDPAAIAADMKTLTQWR